jgi:hypothetical protein
MRNKISNNGFVHVLDPSITKRAMDVYDLMLFMRQEDHANKQQSKKYHANLAAIQQYIDTRLDLFENKFLVFICSITNVHWISVVVVNAFVVHERHLRSDDELYIHELDLSESNNDDMAGWCVFNSSMNTKGKRDEKLGLQSTMWTKENASYAVRLFLNICSSYLKAKVDNDGNGEEDKKFAYKEPFGHYNETRGIPEFSHLDYDSPSILFQTNGNDCGFAAIANAMAFILQNKDATFMKKI